QPEPLTSLAIDPMVSRVRVRDALIPAHLRNPGRGSVEGALRRGQNRVMAFNVKLDADGTSECFAHK
ncbi:MAG TPA: hypothetical protein VHI51_04660, partial [Ktedonobacterales bacterium]|nr:hypothetical protein [Ktedonobacterales bacterium]